MRTVLLTCTILFLASCSNPESSKELMGCDSIIINFNTPQTNNIEKILTTTENKAIKKLTGYVNGKTTEASNCSYDGNLLFYQKGTLLGDVAFNYSSDSCRHFIKSIDGKLTRTYMNNEAADFLKSLAEGKGWY